MDSKLNVFKKALPGLTILTVFMVVVWFVFLRLVIWLSGVPNPVSSALIAFGGTIVTAAITIVYGKRLELKNAIEQHNRTQKLPAYEEFLSYFMNAIGKGETLDEVELKEAFIKFTQKVMIWGSDAFIKDFARYRLESQISTLKDSADSMEVMHSTERLFFAIRREFGHKNKGLGEGDIMRLFINDYDVHRIALEQDTTTKEAELKRQAKLM